MTKLTPKQYIKQAILEDVKRYTDELNSMEVPDAPDEIDKLYSEIYGGEFGGNLQDAREDFRTSGEETKIKSDNWSRHYESEEVAAKMDDGTWVGWTHWHGGGKHGEPAAIDWMEDAYFLTCQEKEVLTIERTWAKV